MTTLAEHVNGTAPAAPVIAASRPQLREVADFSDTGRAAYTFPRLAGVERVMIGVTAVLAVALGAIGFVASFDAVSKYAAGHGFPRDSYLVPVSIDLGVLVFSIANVALIRVN